MTSEVASTRGTTFNDTLNWCVKLSQSDILPRVYQQKPANLLFAAEYADALGVSRIHVLTSITVINGRPAPTADLMAAMVRQAGHTLRVRGNDEYAIAELIRKDDPDFTFKAEWDMKKADQAGLRMMKKGQPTPWHKYPAAMLRARAISEVIRMGAQEVMCGAIYTPEELGAQVSADGEVIEQQEIPESSSYHQQHSAPAIDSQQPSKLYGPSESAGETINTEEVEETHRSKEDIENDLGGDDLTIDSARALWKEAKNAGYEDLCADIAAIANGLASGEKKEEAA